MATLTAAPDAEGLQDLHKPLGEHVKTSFAASTDDFAAHYTAIADDSAEATQKREAAMLFASAEGHLNEGYDHKEAFKAANDAVAICYSIGDKESMADMLRLVVKAQLLAAGEAKYDKKPSDADRWKTILDKAFQIADGERKLFRAAGSKRGEACMLLSCAEVKLDMRGLGLKTEALRLAAQAHRIFVEIGDKKMEAIALLTMVEIYILTSEKRSAQEAAEQALELFRGVGDKMGEAKALHSVAITRALDDTFEAYTSGVTSAKEALALFEELDLQKLRAKELLSIAQLNLGRDRPDEAVIVAREAFAILRQSGKGFGDTAIALSVLVQAHTELEELNKAVQLSEEDVARVSSAGDFRQLVIVQDILAHAQLKKDNVEEALKAGLAALQTTREFKDKEWEASALLTVVQIQMRRNQLAIASQAAKEAIDIYTEIGDMHQELGVAHHYRAFVNLHSGKYDDALNDAFEAQDLFAQTENKIEGAFATLLVAEAQRMRGSPADEVLVTAKHAQDVLVQAEERRLECIALYDISQIYMDMGNFEKALEAARSRTRILEEAGFRKEAAKAMHTISTIYLKNKDAKMAAQVAREGVKLARAEVDKITEVHLTLQSIAALVQLIVEQQDGAGKPETKLRDEALKVSKDCIALAKRLGNMRLTAHSLFWNGEVLMITVGVDALESAQEALRVFRQIGDKLGEAHSLLLSSSCYLNLAQEQRAQECAARAQEIFKSEDDKPGLQLVEELLARWAVPTMQQQMMQMQLMPQQQEQEQNVGVSSVAVAEKKLSQQDVTKMVMAISMDTLGSDDVELTGDDPLLDMGIDSLMSVSLRNELVTKFSVQLPASVMFDYPTVKDLSGHIHQLANE